jgi:hypothetical protein
MTVISAVISAHCIAVSSDSLITVYNSGKKSYEIIETRRPKIIRLEKFLGAFSYWGLAAKSKYSGWTTYDWLKDISKKTQNFDQLSDYAVYVRNELEKEINHLGIAKKNSGIGIHLTGYENYNGFQIPELFLISNYTDTTYTKIGALLLSRHLFGTMPDEFKSGFTQLPQVEKQFRVKDFLSKGNMFIFNNGDPEMFNPFFSGYRDAMNLSKKRSILKDTSDIEIYRSMARRPIEMVAKAQRDYYKHDKIIVGGRIHDLVIEKNTGSFSSSSGV